MQLLQRPIMSVRANTSNLRQTFDDNDDSGGLLADEDDANATDGHGEGQKDMQVTDRRKPARIHPR